MHVSLLPKLVQEANQAVFDQETPQQAASIPELRSRAHSPGGAAHGEHAGAVRRAYDSAVVCMLATRAALPGCPSAN